MAIDLYQSVTDRLIASLESGNIPWQKPWKARAADNVAADFILQRTAAVAAESESIAA